MALINNHITIKLRLHEDNGRMATQPAHGQKLTRTFEDKPKSRDVNKAIKSLNDVKIENMYINDREKEENRYEY